MRVRSEPSDEGGGLSMCLNWLVRLREVAIFVTQIGCGGMVPGCGRCVR